MRSYPDALHYRTEPDGTRVRETALPLEDTVEIVDGERVEERNLVTCASCHNPHYGYLVDVQTEEELGADLVARQKGDALLRLRDHDNALCDACH